MQTKQRKWHVGHKDQNICWIVLLEGKVVRGWRNFFKNKIIAEKFTKTNTLIPD